MTTSPKHSAVAALSLLSLLCCRAPEKKHEQQVAAQKIRAVVGGRCSPVAYACDDTKTGWLVCDVSGMWVYGGACSPNTQCVFYQPSLSPYCVPPGFQFP